MKKVIFSLFFVLFTFSLFCSSSSANSSKTYHNSLYDLNYELRDDSKGGASLLISSNHGLDMKIKVICKDAPQALDFMMAVEDQLQEDPSAIISPIKLLIDLIKESFTQYSWGKGSVSGDYYFILDLKKEIALGNDHEEDENGIITLTVLDYQDFTAPGTYDDNKYIWDAFEDAHPNIRIRRETLFNEPFHQRTEYYAASGCMPDVFYMWPAGRSSVIHDYKLAKDLTPFLKKEGIYDDYAPICLIPSLQKSGYVAEIPFGITVTHCMFANTKLLAQLGLKPAKTYEELKKQLPVLQAAGKDLIIMANNDDWVMQSCLFSMVLGRLAGADWANDIYSGKAKFTDAPFLKAVEMIETMYKDGVISQKSLSSYYGNVPSLFASGQGAYLIDGDWRSGAFMTDASTGEALISPSKQRTDFELMEFPILPGEIIHSNSGTLGVGYGMSSSLKPGSKKEAAAWELIKWLSGPEMQQRRLDTGASFPSLRKGINYSNREPIVKKRADFYTNTSTLTPVFDSVFSFSVAGVLNIKLQELGKGLCTPMDVCTAVQEAYDSDLYNY